MTPKTIENILVLLKKYNETFSSVARAVNLSVTTVIEIFDAYVQMERYPLPEALCLDEYYFSSTAEYKYNLLLLNFKNGLIIDVLESRHKTDISKYFASIDKKERDKVLYVSIDMHDTYKDVAERYFRNAIICVDSFHVMKLINDALDDMRLKVMRKYEENKKSDEYYLLKHKKFLLFSDIDYSEKPDKVKYNPHFKSFIPIKQLQSMILNIDTDLDKAWELKERYHLFNKTCNSPEEAFRRLTVLIKDFSESGIQEFIKLSTTLDKYKKEICNSFSIYGNRRISNGPIEGRNKYIKLIKKLANGYVNFKRFRNRIMYTLNKHAIPSDSKLNIDIRMHKKGDSS